MTPLHKMKKRMNQFYYWISIKLDYDAHDQQATRKMAKTNRNLIPLYSQADTIHHVHMLIVFTQRKNRISRIFCTSGVYNLEPSA